MDKSLLEDDLLVSAVAEAQSKRETSKSDANILHRTGRNHGVVTMKPSLKHVLQLSKGIRQRNTAYDSEMRA